MRREDWPVRLARYVSARPSDASPQRWVRGWLDDCAGEQGELIDWRLAQRGDIVETPAGLAICVGRHAAGPGELLMPMSEALRAWRVD